MTTTKRFVNVYHKERILRPKRVNNNTHTNSNNIENKENNKSKDASSKNSTGGRGTKNNTSNNNNKRRQKNNNHNSPSATVNPNAPPTTAQPKPSLTRATANNSSTTTAAPQMPASPVTPSPTTAPALSSTPPASVSDVPLFAFAFADTQRPLGFRVVFGPLSAQHAINSSHELDAHNKVVALPTPTMFDIPQHFANNTFVAITKITELPTVGQFWDPRFASKNSIQRQANLASFARRAPDENFDIGEFTDMVGRYTMSDAPEVLNLNSSHQKPPVPAGQINGARLVELLKLPIVDVAQRPELVNKALVKSTVQEHGRMLTKLTALPESCLYLPAPLAIATALWQDSIQHKWVATTLFKYLCSAQGALRILPLYRESAPSIFLSGDPIWAMVMKGARHSAVEHVPKQPKAASMADINKAIKATAGLFKKNVRIIIMLAWLTAARVGCIRQLKSNDFEFNHRTKEVNITFRRGKGVRARETHYTVTTLLMGPTWWKEIVDYVQARSGFLFPASLRDVDITTPLKKAGIEQRSIRRGSLQTMAAKMVPADILMNFSGHKSVNTLNRYLDFGKKRADLAQASLKAARALWDSQLLDDAWLEEDGLSDQASSTSSE